MIKSFKYKGLEKLFFFGSQKGIQAIHAKRITLILGYLDEARSIDDLIIMETFRLHSLKGELKGLWSITVQANWRITFKFKDRNAYIVDYQDYH